MDRDPSRDRILADHTTPEDHARLRELLTSALAAGDRSAGLVHETRVRHADGRLIPFDVHSRLLLDEQGRPAELVGVARDVSGRRERERVLRSGGYEVISGHSIREVQALGGIDRETPWLAKPFTPPALLEALNSLLRRAEGGASGS